MRPIVTPAERAAGLREILTRPEHHFSIEEETELLEAARLLESMEVLRP